MFRQRALSSIVVILVPMLLGAGYLVQTSEERITALEERVTLLEANVSALSGEEGDATDDAELHRVTGVYVGDATEIDGTSCETFYPAGTILFLTNWEGDVLGTSELGSGTTAAGNLCSQPFAFEDIPDATGYTFYLERRVAGSAYEFSFADMVEANWNIEVISRYNQD